MTQKEFYKIFLMSLQQNITTKHKLTEIEKRLDDTDTRLEKLEVVEKADSEAPTEPEQVTEPEAPSAPEPVEEAEAPSAPEPVEEAAAETEPEEEAPAEVDPPTEPETMETEPEQTTEDITTMVEKVEKTRPSRKRSQR